MTTRIAPAWTPVMSALGQKRTLSWSSRMSALCHERTLCVFRDDGGGLPRWHWHNVRQVCCLESG